MDEGGCLYLDFSDELLSELESEVKDEVIGSDVSIVYSDLISQEDDFMGAIADIDSISVTSTDASLFGNALLSSENVEEKVECCICYDPISTEKNNCVTECGHQFCFKCLATSMMTNGCRCPCCRSPLVELSEESDDDDDVTEEDDDSIVSMDEDEMECDIVELTRRLESKGFTMQDVLSMLLGRYVKGTTNNVIFDLNHNFETIVEEADDEAIEREAMGLEDGIRC